jgi:hypothetical protein
MSQQRKLFQDSSSKFFRVNLTPDDEQLAMNVSPLFLAYLQNKIEAYASALVEAKLPYSPNPNEQVAAILAHERLRNYAEAYEELMSELIQASSQPSETNA